MRKKQRNNVIVLRMCNYHVASLWACVQKKGKEECGWNSSKKILGDFKNEWKFDTFWRVFGFGWKKKLKLMDNMFENLTN